MRASRTITSTAAVVALAFLALLGTGTHTVARGETLGGIAARYGTSASALAAANGISDPDRVLAGARLAIPGQDRAASTHTVRPGDTLGRIAADHGTSIAALVSLNGIDNANLIRIGQVLKVPAGGGAPGGGSAPTGGAGHHIVVSGDTIGGIARRYGISQDQLIAANGLTGGVVYVGQRLSLLPAQPAGSTTSYTVRPGDTLSSIAKRHGTTVRALQAANQISDPDRVLVGSTLTIPSTAGGTTTLPCPVQGSVRFMNDWGFPRSGGRFHEGNDLFAARGTPVVAVVAGSVAHTTSRLGGNQAKLAGDDGASYYFTHLDRFGRSGRVAEGTVIGYVGSSGNAAGGPTHLHFEVHPGGGAAVNPYPRIQSSC